MRTDYLGLEAFVAIAELGSFSRAAAYLNLSQTALSHRIRKIGPGGTLTVCIIQYGRQCSHHPGGLSVTRRMGAAENRRHDAVGNGHIPDGGTSLGGKAGDHVRQRADIRKRFPGKAEAARDSGEICPAEDGAGIGHAFRAQLVDLRPVCAVIHDHDENVELVPADGFQLLDMHQDAAVTVEHDDRTVRARGSHAHLEPAKSNWARPITDPPFYGYSLRTGVTFTYLGLKVDGTARVSGSGGPLANVWAAGEIMAGSILGQGYLAGFGMTIGTVFGRIAGREAAAHVA
jgi:hypothetical protein